MRLTAQQTHAVQSWKRGDICVIAGPGSGKTRVLVERMRWLILERGVPPERILAITFTEKAAHEMRARLIAGDGVSPEQRSSFETTQVSTIDAFCNRLLREHAVPAGVDPGFEILDETEAWNLLHGAIEQVLDDAFANGGRPLGEFLASYVAGGSSSPRGRSFALRDEFADLIHRIRSYGCEPFLRDDATVWSMLARALGKLAAAKNCEDLVQLASRIEATPAEDLESLAACLKEARAATAALRKRGPVKDRIAELKDEFLPACQAALTAAANRAARQWLLDMTQRILEAFAAAKHAIGRLDFDDVLAHAVGLLRAGEGPQLHFEHILIDEFQDTNPLQVQLVECLMQAHGEHRPVRFIVGDVNQSIYGFRHADQNVFRVLRETVEQQGGHVVRLLENFRSRSEILDAVHRLSPGGPGSGVEHQRLESANRFPDKPEPSLEVQIVEQAGESALEWEAAWMAQRLHALKSSLRITDRRGTTASSRALKWGDIGILLRTHDKLARFAAVLRQRGVPCQASTGRGLFQAPETAELAAFLRILRNPRDEISLATVLKSPFCGIGDATLLQLKLDHGNLAEALDADLPRGVERDADASARLRRFRDLLGVCRADRDTVPVRGLLARAVAACGYRSFLSRRHDGGQALANLDRLPDWIEQRAAQGIASLDGISAELDRALEIRLAGRESPDYAAGGGAVQLLTMHGAKGLEFPVVAVASLQSGGSGRTPSLLFSQEHGLGARWRNSEGEALEDTAYRLTADEIRRRESEEADRLFYVAMTRAEEHLLLSASFSRAPQRRSWCKPLFAGLRLDPKKTSAGSAESRSVEQLRFRYLRAELEPPEFGQGGTARLPDEPQILRPLPPSAQADYSAAVTSISLFAQCPRKYYLSRYLGLETHRLTPALTDEAMESVPDRDGTDASEFGSQVHRYLAGELDETEVGPAVRRLAKTFWEHPLGRRTARANHTEKELSFVFAVGDSMLRGTIDLLFEEGGERILLDYKTDHVPRRELQAAARNYAMQIQLYAAGLAKSGRQASRAVLFFLRHETPVDIDIGEQALENAQQLVREFFEAQRRHRYPLRTGRHCRLCPHYQGACPAELS